MSGPGLRSGVAGVLFGAVLMGCGAPTPDSTPPAQRAFAWWRTTLRLSPAESAALRGHGISRLYVRAFDVAPDATGRPGLVAPVHLEAIPGGVEIVPVVFIREAVLRGPPAGAGAPLADEILGALRALSRRAGLELREVQLDCDWTDGSRDGFFALLRALRRAAGPEIPTLSTTLRLHQIKYRERTGVPPADRGLLMFYNTGTLTAGGEGGEGTSIFDAERARGYLSRLPDYPLPLDVALPIWSWTVHVREGRVEGLLQSTDPAELAEVPFLEPSGRARFDVTSTAFFRGHLLRAGDRLVGEVTGPAESLAAARLVAPHLPVRPPGSTRFVALFDLSERNLSRHDPQSLEQLFEAVR